MNKDRAKEILEKFAAHFYERYALDANNFYDNLEKIADKFENDFKLGKSKDECLENFESSVKDLLQNPHPPRYFSFLKAQCDLYVDRINKQDLEKINIWILPKNLMNI